MLHGATPRYFDCTRFVAMFFFVELSGISLFQITLFPVIKSGSLFTYYWHTYQLNLPVSTNFPIRRNTQSIIQSEISSPTENHSSPQNARRKQLFSFHYWINPWYSIFYLFSHGNHILTSIFKPPRLLIRSFLFAF